MSFMNVANIACDVFRHFNYGVRCSNYGVRSSPNLGQGELENSGVKAHAGTGVGEPFRSVIGGLLPIALCGRTSL